MIVPSVLELDTIFDGVQTVNQRAIRAIDLLELVEI